MTTLEMILIAVVAISTAAAFTFYMQWKVASGFRKEYYSVTFLSDGKLHAFTLGTDFSFDYILDTGVAITDVAVWRAKITNEMFDEIKNAASTACTSTPPRTVAVELDRDFFVNLIKKGGYKYGEIDVVKIMNMMQHHYNEESHEMVSDCIDAHFSDKGG